MTALEQYVRLEASGRWRETPGGDWREVLVSFGNATLVLSDFEEHPLTHWSLAAVERVDEGGTPALYAPDAGTPELLEVADEDMISAIAEVSRMARIRQRPPRARRRWPLALAAAALVAAAAALWGPDALRARAFALITPEQAGLVAEDIRNRLAEHQCATPEGTRSLRRLAARAVPGTRLEVMDWDRPVLALMPDGAVLLGHTVPEGAAAAETVAGWAVLGAQARPQASPLWRWIEGMDAGEVLVFLSSGEIGRADVAGMARGIEASRYAPSARAVEDAAATLSERGIDPGPFLADMGRRYPDLSLPQDGVEQAEPVLPRDQDWVALQNICGG